MAEEIGLKAWEYGENLQDGYQKVDVRKNDKEPLKLAEEYAEKSERYVHSSSWHKNEGWSPHPVWSNGFYVDISNQRQMQQYKSCLKWVL